jgi:hypothetical protein
MNYRRWVAKAALVLMMLGFGSLAAVVPASPAAAACSIDTGISGPTRNGTIVQVLFHIDVQGCGGYWTEYSSISGPGASDNGRTVTYRGDRHYVLTMNVACRTGTYTVYLQLRGEHVDSFRQTSKYISC